MFHKNDKKTLWAGIGAAAFAVLSLLLAGVVLGGYEGFLTSLSIILLGCTIAGFIAAIVCIGIFFEG